MYTNPIVIRAVEIKTSRYYCILPRMAKTMTTKGKNRQTVQELAEMLVAVRIGGTTLEMV